MAAQARKTELEKYFESFIARLADRMDELRDKVNAYSDFVDWHADLSPDSLGDLGCWFCEVVNTRARTADEMRTLRAKLPLPHEISSRELTDQTFSQSVDVGIYFAETLRKNHPTLHWTQDLANRRSIDYGYVVLTGFKGLFLNPVRIGTTYAYGIVAGELGPDRLTTLFEFWSSRVRGPSAKPPSH